jgi:proliferating cell nuclear antigen
MPKEHKNILELQTVQSNAIRILCEVLKETLNDVNIKFDSKGMKIMAMDGSHVALIHLRLHADRFEHYYCERTINAGLNMLNLYKLMKTVTNTDIVTLFISEDKEHELGIKIENADKNSCTIFSLKMLDIDDNELKIPDVELDSVITMPSNEFQRICRDMMNISESVTMTSTQNALVFTCDGDYARQETIIGEATHGLIFNKTEKISGNEVSGNFSLKYINLFTKSTNLSNTLDIYMKKNYPLMLKYNVANLGEIMFCLAPKTEKN